MNNIVIELKSEKSFEFDIAKALKDFIVDKSNFYWIVVYKDKIVVKEEGYNTPPINLVIFKTNNLVNNFKKKQTRDAIVSIYQYTFMATDDIIKRVKAIMMNPNADLHQGASHAFYNDRTGKYPEHKIVKRIVMLNNENEIQNDKSTEKIKCFK